MPEARNARAEVQSCPTPAAPCENGRPPSPGADDLSGQLRALMARGFRFAHPLRANGDVAAVVGVRAHHTVVDIVQLLGEHDADAARVPGDEPDILFPRRLLWRATGRAREVLDKLLDLDDECPTAAVAPQRGWWIPTSPGHATWLRSNPPVQAGGAEPDQ